MNWLFASKKVHSNLANPCESCEEKLHHADLYLKFWFLNHVKRKWPNAHISWAYRGRVDQELAFTENKSQLHFPDSPHNKKPAKALDLFQIDGNGKGIWDIDFFGDIDKYNVTNNITLKWGGNFESFKDYCHFEL